MARKPRRIALPRGTKSVREPDIAVIGIFEDSPEADEKLFEELQRRPPVNGGEKNGWPR